MPWAALAVGVVVTAGIAARFVARSHLWLDEALTVNIAGLPLQHLAEALRHDGSPPLYYVVLHGWIRLFGTGTVAAVTASVAVCAAAQYVVNMLLKLEASDVFGATEVSGVLPPSQTDPLYRYRLSVNYAQKL